MSMNRRQFFSTMTAIGATAAVGTLVPAAAYAALPRVNLINGLALDGFDPVAYFTVKKPVKGNSAHSAVHEGATFHFSSAENKAAFVANPTRFAPQYGGYCAFAVSRGYTANGDPQAWSVFKDKLYLNVSKSVRLLWSTNKSGNVRSADKNWPSVLNA